MLVSFERTLFYLMVVAITKTVSFDHKRTQKYRDGEQRVTRENQFKTDTRQEPLRRSSSHFVPPGTIVSRSGNLGESNLASSEDGVRLKEVVHVPCPKRINSKSRAEAGIRGSQQESFSSEINENDQGFRVAKDSRFQGIPPYLKLNQNPGQPTDLNQAVKQNQQWLISNQGFPQPQKAQNYDNQESPSSPSLYTDKQNKQTGNAYQLQPMPDIHNLGHGSPHNAMQPTETAFDTSKGSQKQANPNKYDFLSPLQHSQDNRRIKMTYEGNQAIPQMATQNTHPNLTPQMVGSNQQYLNPQNQKAQDPVSNVGLNQQPSMAYDTKNTLALPSSRKECDLPGIKEAHQYLTNTLNNLTYGVPSSISRTMDSPNQSLPYLNSSYNELIPSNHHGITNFPNNVNRGINNGYKQNNATMPNGAPLNYGYNTDGEKTSKYLNWRSFKGEEDVNQPQSQGQFEINEGSHGDLHGSQHRQYKEYQNLKSGVENWKEFHNSQSESTHEQHPKNTLTVSSQLVNKNKIHNQVNMEKSPGYGLAAIKGFFGKHNREDVKGRQSTDSDSKPSKSKGYNVNIIPPSAINAFAGNKEETADNVSVGQNERSLINGQKGIIVEAEEPNGFDKGYNKKSGIQKNGMMINDQYYNQMNEVEVPKGHHETQASMRAPLQPQAVDNMYLPTDTQNNKGVEIVPQTKSANDSRSLSHILSPPVTVEPHLFTNKGLKVVSKVPIKGETLYHPFMGYGPVRNDEAFYDKKNMNFLGPINHPPPVNLKRNKVKITEKLMKPSNKYFKWDSDKYTDMDNIYSEPADINSNMIAENIQLGMRSDQDRQARKCHQNRRTFSQYLKGHGKRGLHRSKWSPYRSEP